MWQKFISDILGQFFRVIADIFVKERKEKLAQKHEWDAEAYKRALESVKAAEAMEKALTPSKLPPVVDLSQWGKPLLPLLLLVLLVPGCITRTIYKAEKFPEIPLAERPAIDVVTPLSEREKSIVGYALTLEDQIKRYNKIAFDHNKIHGYED